MDYKSYQPGTKKLIRHLEHLQKIRDGIPVGPIHISVWPNSQCNFSCSWCCGRNIVNKGGELSLERYIKMIDILQKYSCKAVEFSGSVGEPLLWKPIENAVKYNYEKGLKTSLITNGMFLKNVSTETLQQLNWIRVSIQNLAHMNIIDFEKLSEDVRISASHIVATEQNLSGLNSLWKSAKKRNIIIRVAVARPCTEEWEARVEEEVLKLGEPLFFSKKERGSPFGCFMPWIRGAVNWEGNFLPCPSIQLNIENEGYIPEEYVLCNIDNLEEWILNNPPKDLGYRCKMCNCGKENNDFVYNLLQETEDVDFV